MNIRELGFWTLDCMQGRRHRRYYNDIKRKYGNASYDDEKEITELLQYAIKKCSML